MAWACHRKCRHCYEDRFRPYVRGALEAVVQEAERNFPRILANFPERFTYRDLDDAAGGRDVSREDRARDSLRRRVAARSGARARHLQGDRRAARKVRRAGRREGVVQTTGDILTDAIVDELLQRGVWMISVASVDDFHVGLEGPAKQKAFMDKLSRCSSATACASAACRRPRATGTRSRAPCTAFSARRPTRGSASCGRAAAHGRTTCRTATLADNFCNRWSGGLNFLRHQYNGSEVSVEPDGAVYPCCVKTKLPIGSLLEDNLIDDPRFARGRACVRGDHDGPPGAHGPRVRLGRGRVPRRSRARARRTGRPTRTCASAATAFTNACWGRCSKRRVNAGVGRRPRGRGESLARPWSG